MLNLLIVYFQLEENAERLQAMRMPNTPSGIDPTRVKFMEYVNQEALGLSPQGWDFFRDGIFALITKARHKGAQEPVQVV